MRKIHFTFFLAFLSITSFSQKVGNFNFELYLQSKLKHSVTEWDVEQLKKDSSVLIIDVRERKEYDVSHLKNAINFPYKKFKIEQLSPISKNKKIVVYCSVGYRSEKIVEKLEKAGYKKSYNLFGGIFEWVNQGNPVYDQNENITKKIHAYSRNWGVWLEKGEKIYE